MNEKIAPHVQDVFHTNEKHRLATTTIHNNINKMYSISLMKCQMRYKTILMLLAKPIGIYLNSTKRKNTKR